MNGKAKGGQFEREICVKLSLWISNGERKDLLWRSAMSGGRATIHKKGEVRQAGDICAVAPEGHKLTDLFYIECKHLKKISLDGLIKGNGSLLAIWRKTKQEAYKYGKIPCLIFRQNGWPIVFCSSSNGVAAICIEPHLGIKGLVWYDDLCLSRLDEVLKNPFPFANK